MKSNGLKGKSLGRGTRRRIRKTKSQTLPVVSKQILRELNQAKTAAHTRRAFAILKLLSSGKVVVPKQARDWARITKRVLLHPLPPRTSLAATTLAMVWALACLGISASSGAAKLQPNGRPAKIILAASVQKPDFNPLKALANSLADFKENINSQFALLTFDVESLTPAPARPELSVAYYHASASPVLAEAKLLPNQAKVSSENYSLPQGAVLGASTVKKSSSKPKAKTVVQPSSLQTEIESTLNLYMAEGKFKGPKGDKGDIGTSSGITQNGNGISTLVVGGNPIVSYVPSDPQNGFQPTTLSGFGNVSASNFSAQSASIGGAITVQGDASIGGDVSGATGNFTGLNIADNNGGNGFTIDQPNNSTLIGTKSEALLSNSDPTVGNYSILGFANAAGGLPSVKIGAQFTDRANGYGDFVIGTRNVSGLNEVMRVTSAGNVGIGTSTPGSALTVNGNINFTGNLYQNGTLFTSGGGGSSQWTTATSSVIYYNMGNVGIGTTTPSQLLSVVGNMRLTGALFDSTNASGTLGQILETTGTSTQWVATSTLGFGGGGGVTGGTNGKVAVFTSATTLGTGDLLDNLTVSGVNATSSTVNFNIQGTGTLNPFNVASSSGTSLLRVLANGNIGIGTSSPSQLLTIGNNNQFTVSNIGNINIATLTPSSLVVTDGSRNLASSNININNLISNVSTGTSGTIFNISTSTNSLTINLPIASSVNTGQLQAADWTTFNNKVSNAYASSTFVSFNYGSSTYATIANYPSFTYASNTFATLLNTPSYSYASSTFVTYSYGSSTYQTLLTNPDTGTGTNGQVPYFTAANTLTSASDFLNNGTVAGVNATSSTVNFNIQGTGTLNPFNVASSSGASELFVGSNGNVGIGTSSPGALLSLYQPTSNSGLSFGDTSGTNYILGENYSDSKKFKISASGAFGTNDVFTIDPVAVGNTDSPSYSNPGGMGNRSSLITVSLSNGSFFTGGNGSALVNGTYGNSEYFTGFGTSGNWIEFDFGSGASKVITEATWYQSDATAEGTWQWQGSNDNSTWTTIGGSFGLGGTTTETITTLSGNFTGYRYYRMAGVSGNTFNSPYIQGINFKIDSAGAYTNNYYTGINNKNPAGALDVQGYGLGTGLTFRATNLNGLSNFAIQDNGNVGLGTSTPGYQLVVASSSTTQPTALIIATSSQTSNLLVVASSSGASYLTVLANGNVGLGTSTSSYELSVVSGSTGTPTALIMATSSQSSNILVVASSSGTSYFTVAANGNIGIGTSSPSQLLTLGNNNQFTVASSGNVSIANLSQGSIPYIGASGLVSQDNYNLYWDSTDARLSIGGTPSSTYPSTMTSDSSPTPYVVSGSSYLSAGYDAYYAFDGNNTASTWQPSGQTGWLKVDLGASAAINQYQLHGYNNESTYACDPKTWTFEGSNTGAFGGEQVILDTETNVTSWTNSQVYTYSISTANYRYYRLNISADNGWGDVCVATFSINNTGFTPLAKLDISTVTSNEKGFIVQGITGQTADLQEWQGQGGTTILGAVNAAGLFGIGTSSPTAMLFVHGASTTTLLNITASSNATALYVSNLGNIGIGTSTPGYQLVVASSSTTQPTTLIIATPSQTSNLLVVASSTGTSYLTVASNGSTTLSSLATGPVYSASGSLYIGPTSDSGSGTNGQIAYYTAGNTLTSASDLLNNGTVAGVNATSSTVNFNIQGTGTLNPFNVASSSGTSELAVTSAGNVGIGASGPVAKFQIGSPGSAYANNHGDILLNDSGVNGPEAAGGIEIESDTTSYGQGYKIYSNDTNGYLGIGTRYNSASWTNSMAIMQQSGEVEIGTTTINSSSFAIAQGSILYGINVQSSNSGGYQANFNNNATGNGCYLAGGATNWSCYSDENLKTNITPISGDDALVRLAGIEGVTFNWKASSTSPEQVGVIAQDVQQAFPQAVSTGPDGYLAVEYDGLIGPIISGLDELNARTQVAATATTSALELTTASSTAATSTPWVGGFASASNALQSAIQSIGQQIVHIFKDAIYATTGIFDKVFAKEVHTDELCVGSTCVTQAQFLQMVQQSGVNSTNDNNSNNSSTASSGSNQTNPDPDSSNSSTSTITSDQGPGATEPDSGASTDNGATTDPSAISAAGPTADSVSNQPNPDQIAQPTIPVDNSASGQ